MRMLKEYIREGFGTAEDLSCSETILYGANRLWNLGLDKNALKMAAGLSGGCYTGNICGALSASAMVISRLYVEDRAHSSPRNEKLVEEMISRYKEAMGDDLCTPLRENYRTEEEKCRPVILKAAEILDDIVRREGMPSAD